MENRGQWVHLKAHDAGGHKGAAKKAALSIFSGGYRPMDNWIDLTNYGIAVAGLMVVLMGLIMSIFSRYQEEWDRKLSTIR